MNTNLYFTPEEGRLLTAYSHYIDFHKFIHLRQILNLKNPVNISFFNKCIALALELEGFESLGLGDEIPDEFFKENNFLTSVIIPNSVTSIGGSAFTGCSGLTSVTIPDSVTSIGSRAFEYCSNLTSIAIPNSVKSIGSSAFYGCENLTSVHITNIAKWCNISFDDYSANPLYYAHNLYLNNELVTNLVIPDSVWIIDKYAFRNCSSLTSVVIPNAYISSCAFDRCTALESITIGNCVTKIEALAFSNCSKLKVINYKRTKSKWEAIWKEPDWDEDTGNYTIICTNGKIKKEK